MTTHRPTPPRLNAPLLVRRPDLLQIGSESPHAVLLPGPPAQRVAALLGLLDGTTTPTALEPAATALGLSTTAWHTLLDDLLDRGLLVRAHGAVPHRSGQIRVVGTGALAADLVGLLARTPVERIFVADPATDPSAADVFVRRVRRDLPVDAAAVLALRHWTKPGDRGVDLTVLASDRAEADRSIAGDLVRGDQPHLVLGCRPDTVTVGPMVLPGRSPCLRCLDLGRADKDPDWPVTVGLLGSVPESPSALGRAWAAVTATTQVLGLLGDRRPTAPGSAVVATVLELDESTGAVRTRRFAAHAGCGCHWGGAAEWAP